MNLTLASGSPRRRQLLESAGFDFSIATPDVDETPLADEAPEIYVRRLAETKSTAVEVAGLVLGADTTVAIDGAILGKPVDANEAGAMLRRLSGRVHEVLTGWAIAKDGAIVEHDVERSAVTFRALNDHEIHAYVASGEPLDKAGAYAIQGGAAGFVAELDGLHSNVMGLPIERVTESLASLGVAAQR